MPVSILWSRHYISGVTGSFHGDMALAFERMLADIDASRTAVEEMNKAIRFHMGIEQRDDYSGRRWFCERFTY